MVIASIDFILLGILFIYVIIATIQDIKTREVPDWLNYSLISIALSLRFLYSLITNEWNYFLYGIMGAFIFFIVGNIMYYTRQWGGGDSKLLMGIGATIPIYPSFLLNYLHPNLNLPFLFILIVNILLVGGLYGIFLSAMIALKHRAKFKTELMNLLKKEKIKTEISYSILIIAVMLFVSIYSKSMLRIVGIGMALFIFILGILLIFIKTVENVSMYKIISINKLTEGDWVVPFKFKSRLITTSYLGVTKKDIARFKDMRIKTVMVKEGLPFVPAFLIGLIITLIFGNVLAF
ncbi:MAG: A24 family peptidase [Candidatus Nanoarchaeia archaeon]|nr:A24 family peptidase [Candidatus Nanoarchaeia archaeon]MDD5588038.1 A24 family peptidase [Candidatus Nanoarchaeia archaeon]